MKLDELKNKKVLILGFGKEGKDTLKFLRKLCPKKVVGIADQKKSISPKPKLPNIKWYLGENYLKALKNYDVIIKSPGVPLKILPKDFLNKVTSQTEIFFDNCPGKIIGVTGTKGKSTTASLIYKILKQGGVKVHLVGNIGKPVLSLLFSATPKDVYVYELSSHQLATVKKSPHIAVFLNIYPEHLDYYKNFNEYLKAKANITKYQTKKDFFIYSPNNKLLREIAKVTKAKKIPISLQNREFKKIMNKIKKNPLIGKFNLQNLAAAVAVGKIFKISDEDIAKSIEHFKPLPHRLEYIGEFQGIKFYNDALSTVPEATIASLDSLGDDVETIFLGGFDRGLDFKNLAKRILKSKVKILILFPTTGEKIWQEIVKLDGGSPPARFRAFLVQNMKDAVKLAFEYTDKGKICLLSTASASFSLFKDYKEKGNLFKKYVKSLAKYGKTS